MHTIGLIGGMSWESTAEYYRLLNEGTRTRLGGHHSPHVLLESLDFAQIHRMQRAGNWGEAGVVLADAANTLEHAGADVLLLCTNLMHKVADQITAATSLPLLHIADAVGAHATAHGYRRLGLLGTRWVMEEDFYRDLLTSRYNLEVLVPNAVDRDRVDRVIFDELTQGRIEASSRDAYQQVISRLAASGADAVILGCTEITLLVSLADSPLPVIDSTTVHVDAALEWALTETTYPASIQGDPPPGPSRTLGPSRRDAGRANRARR